MALIYIGCLGTRVMDVDWNDLTFEERRWWLLDGGGVVWVVYIYTRSMRVVISFFYFLCFCFLTYCKFWAFTTGYIYLPYQSIINSLIVSGTI